MQTVKKGELRMASEKQKPAHEIRMGRIKATIWHNIIEGGSSRYNVQIRRIYKEDKSDEWKTADSFGRDDLPLVVKIADMAHTWIYERAQEQG